MKIVLRGRLGRQYGKNLIITGEHEPAIINKLMKAVPEMYGRLENYSLKFGKTVCYVSERLVGREHSGDIGGGNQQQPPIIAVPGPIPPKYSATTSTTLQSIQQSKILYAMSEGIIDGFVHPSQGLRDVYLDDVPVQNSDGTFNFNGIAVAATAGTTTQKPITGMNSISTLLSSGANILQASPVTVSITNPNVNSVMLNIYMSSCQVIGGAGNSVVLKIEVSANGGAYVNVTDRVMNSQNTAAPGTIMGWSAGPYTAGFRVPLPTGTNWLIRITRVSLDAAGLNQNPTALQSYALITEENLSYPSVALMAAMFDAHRFPSMPKLSVLINGVRVKVPNGYTAARQGGVSLNSFITTTGVNLQISAAGIITQASGNFTTAGYLVGNAITVAGFANSVNNGKFIISVVGTTTMTIIPQPGVTLTFITESSGSGRTLSSSAPPQLAITSTTIITRSGNGSFLNEGFASGQRISLTGFSVASNNGTFTIQSVTASTITINAASLTIETSAAGRTITTAWSAAVYPGSWDGTWVDGWTSNPSFILWDMATNKRYGAGRYLLPANVDKWGIYAMAQYCDALVSDGYGGLEPRFTFNGYLQTSDDAYKVFADIASSARAQVFYGAGMITPVQDTDTTPAGIFTRANVKDGKFVYQSSARKARHTVCNVTWTDPAQLYAQVVETVQCADLVIQKYGVQTVNVTAVGCTSLGQARRYGRTTLLVEQGLVEVVTFTTGLQGITTKVGDIILIQDAGRVTARLGGRIVSATASQITVDNPTVLAAGQTYTLYAAMPDGTIQSATVTNSAGTYTVLNLGSALTTAPQSQAQWVLSSANSIAGRWRIISIAESVSEEAMEYAVTAVQNIESLYSLFDSTDSIVPITNNLRATPGVSGLTASYTTIPLNGSPINNISVSWTAPANATPTSYQALCQIANGVWKEMTVSGTSAVIQVPDYGQANIRVTPIYSWGVGVPMTTSVMCYGIVASTINNMTFVQSTTNPPVVVNEYRQLATEGLGGSTIVGGVPTQFTPVYLTVTFENIDWSTNPALMTGYEVVFSKSNVVSDISSYLLPICEVPMKTKPLALSNITITGAAKTISVPNGGLIAAGFKTGVVFYLSGVASGSGPFVAGTVTDNSIMVPLATWTDQSIPTSYITPVQSATVSIVPQTGFSVWAFARQLYYGNVVGGWNNVSGVTVASTNQQLASLTYIGNDGILSVGEKPAVFADYTGLLSQITMLRSEATTLCAVLPTQNTLLAYLTGLGPWPWTDRTVGHDTVIPDPSIWTSKWSEIYNEIAALTANISAALNVLGAGGLISANNLIPNWDSELGPRPLSAGFNVYDTQLTAPLGTSKGYNASRYCRKYAGVGGATGFGGYITSYQTEAPTKCKAGKTYAINYMVKEISNSGTSITGDVGFLIAFSDGSGSSVGSAIILWGWNPALAFGTWWETGVASGLPTLLFTAPTGAASFSVQVICGNGFSGAGVELWLDNVSLIELPTLAAAATVGGTVDSVVTAIASKVVAPNTLVQRDSSGVVYSNCWNYASQLRASTQLVGAFNINDSSLLSGWDQPGMYRFGNAGTDNPGVSYGNMLTLCAGSDSMSQIVCDYLKPRMFIRSANWTGTWTFNGGGANGWTEVWTNNNNGGTITAANGYRKFADGQIMIWGVAAAGTSITWSGTLTFPNACLNVFLTPASAPSAIPYASTLTTTGCTVNNVGAILRYLAIGY